jgi:uncharacterized protein (TIGR01777 family)
MVDQAMKIVISGATGFLGRPLAASLVRDGHAVALLSRGAAAPAASSGARLVAWTPDGTAAGPWAREIDGADLVINLAGESIADRRWTAAQKARILDSRVLATRSLAEAALRASSPPSVFISGSASGYYGPRGDEVLTENAPPGHDFLASVCVQWEAEAARVATARTRVVCVRTGVVLGRDGGALSQMLLPFRLGVGGPVGSGRQYLPWIHRQDWIELVRFAIRTPSIAGPLNLTAPNPVTSAVFAKALGRALHRPALLPTPAFALRLLFGEMADALLLSGQRVVPAKAEASGFAFAFPTIDRALQAIFEEG